MRLSGGERQRIALARALARDPEILVLDEATNAVDGISTALILRTLLEVGRGRTVVVVTHRADLVDAAEHVVVLDAGRVVEHGSAAALAGRGGLFARLRTAGGSPAARAS
jgi:ABC-type multidrug transport system fused ATPase/permease subunit